MKWFGATLVFVAELGMLAGLAWWGLQVADGAAGWALALAAPVAAAVVWGAFLAPRAPKPLKPPLIATLVRLDLLLLGAAAAFFTGARELGIATAVAAVVGTLLAGSDTPGATHPDPASAAPGRMAS